MSFTDGKPWVVTKEDVEAKWGTREHHLRCLLCGYLFKNGDVCRFVYANFANSPFNYGNFFTCTGCDGPDVLDRATLHALEAKQKFWFFTVRK